MKREDLKDSRRYRLTRDVKNPQLDKRERYDVAKLAWSAGDIFRAQMSLPDETARAMVDSLPEDKRARFLAPRVTLRAVYIQATPRSAHHSVYEAHEGFEALVEALEELPMSAKDVCIDAGVENYGAVLNKLVELGKATLADVERAATAVYNEYE